ncbi:MAG: sigma-54 dependent transcriptional regulator [Desulfurivibrionaceae bacterium]|jgi:two-component system response regulator HydG
MKKNRPVSILVVDDDKTHRIMLKTMLKQWGWQIEEADDGTTAIKAVHSTPFDAILMDVRMTKLDGIEALRQIHAYNPAIPVIIMTAYSSVNAAVEAIKIGAHDYLTKPLDFDRLKLTMTHALEHRQVQENKDFSRTNKAPAMNAGGIIGSSGPMRELMEMVSYVAPTEATVLISGESGTGKELIAAALHHNSARKNGPFVKVNCAALVENLLESELFGHEKGAFTGADRRREGRFVQANGGTIFLDEISETSPGMQAKLLRVLQEHEVQRVGGQETLAVDVRVLAASNRKLEEEVAQGAFREDLYYRLNVVPLHVPPLKDRREDIPPLAEYFVEKFAKKNNRQVSGITPRCMTLLLNYPWPGNVRELENAIERGIILMRGDYLDEESLPIPVRRFATKNENPSTSTPPGSLEEAEQIVIKNILAETGGNKSEASRRLNITRKTLLSKMHKYGLT